MRPASASGRIERSISSVSRLSVLIPFAALTKSAPGSR